MVLLNMRIFVVLECMQKQWAWFTVWPQMFFTAHSSLCESGWKEYLSYFRRQTERKMASHPHFLSSILLHTPLFHILIMISLWPLLYRTHIEEKTEIYLCVTFVPQPQLSTHHLCIAVVPLVVTYGSPLPCVKDFHCALWLRSAPHQSNRKCTNSWQSQIYKFIQILKQQALQLSHA